MARTFLVERAGGNPAGPFGLRELEGQFLRGDIEPGTKVCEVGRTDWKEYGAVRLDALKKRRGNLDGAGLLLCVVGLFFAIKFAFALKSSSQDMRYGLLETYRSAKNEEKATILASAVMNGRKVSSRQLDEVDTRYAAKAADVEAQIASHDKRKAMFGVVGLLLLGGGVSCFVVSFKSKPVNRPGSPTPASAPATAKPSAASMSEPSKAKAQPLPPPPKASKPAKPKEPKAICENCGQHIAFPREMDGQRFDCPSCGKSTILADASDVL